MRTRKYWILIGILLIISPIFGIILADIVGYHEPLDVAAEKLGLEDLTEQMNWTPFLDYIVPGIPDEIGYIIAGLIGIFVIFIIGYILQYLAGRRK